MRQVLLRATIFFTLAIVCQLIKAQGTWTQKADYPDQVFGAVAFAIGDYGYLGLGWNPAQTNAFWKYDPSLDQWTQNTDFPGVFLGHSVGFTIGDKGYIGTGISGPGSIFHNEFWQYDTLGDTWIQKADFGGVPRSEATGFSINGKGYIGTGWNQTDGFRKDFWEYDPINDQWIQKANFPGTSRIGAVGFSINGKGYIGLGYDSTGFRDDLWEYNPISDSWVQKADFPSNPRTRAVVFIINNVCLLGTGYSSSGMLNDFWQYDSSTDTWTQIADVGTLLRQGSVGFTINNKGYIGVGGLGGAPYYDDFWEYSDITLNVEELTALQTSIFPNPSSSETTFWISQELINATLTVNNSYGQTVKEIKNISGQKVVLLRDNMASGLYFLQLTQDDKIVATGKLVIVDN